ncbi:unnamed protein product [Dicrocoelium dendriticum]|nr:unnamed protein product [Dicrocoelium dendriticum]
MTYAYFHISLSQILNIQRERDEAILANEAEKQALLSACENERVTINERLMFAHNQVKSLERELDHSKREFETRREEQEKAKAELTQELKEFRRHFEETWLVRTSLLQKELHSAERRISELKETSASREKEIKQAIEHASCEQRRLIEARNQLQNGLDQVSANASELRTTLCGAEEKISCLEARLQASEQARKELDHKLAAIHTSLRRLIGYRQDQHPVSRQRRLDAQSPEKSGYAPKNPAITQQQCKKPDELSGSNADWKFPVSEKASGSCFTSNNTLDPDCVRMALQEFVQRYTNVKRDLEDAKAEVTSLQSRLKEQTEQTELWSKRLHQVQQALCDAEADKKGVDGRLSSTQTALMLQEEALRKNERDRKLLTEKISQLERQLTSSEAERQEEQVGDPKEGNS